MFLFGYKWQGELSEADAVSVVHLHSPLGPCSFTFPWYRLLQYTRIQARVIPAVVLAKISYSLKWKMSFSEWQAYSSVPNRSQTYDLPTGTRDALSLSCKIKKRKCKKEIIIGCFWQSKNFIFFSLYIWFQVKVMAGVAAVSVGYRRVASHRPQPGGNVSCVDVFFSIVNLV